MDYYEERTIELAEQYGYELTDEQVENISSAAHHLVAKYDYDYDRAFEEAFWDEENLDIRNKNEVTIDEIINEASDLLNLPQTSLFEMNRVIPGKAIVLKTGSGQEFTLTVSETKPADSAA